MVVVNLTRSRAENLGNIARGLALLPPGGRSWSTGAKSDGVDSLARQVARAVAARRCLRQGARAGVLADPPEALPAEVALWARAAEPAPNAEGFVTAPGIFSPDQADPGSRRLAAAFAGRLTGRVADLGAGWGWLAGAVLAGSPGHRRARPLRGARRWRSTRRAPTSRDPRARFHWTDVPGLGAGVPPYDAVITNPPFHQGRAAEPDLGAAFIAAAARILKPSGQLLMVANRQLPYEAVLATPSANGRS